MCVCLCVFVSPCEWRPTPKTPIWLQPSFPVFFFLFYTQSNNYMSIRGWWPALWMNAGPGCWLDEAPTDGQSDSEVQTGDVPESNYESFSLSLCLHFSLALSSLSLPDFPLVHLHNPSSWTASSLRLILMQSTSVCAHKHTYRWHVVATARNSVCSDPDRLKHKTLYLKRISGVYSYTCQPIRGVRTDTYTCFYSVLLY